VVKSRASNCAFAPVWGEAAKRRASSHERSMQAMEWQVIWLQNGNGSGSQRLDLVQICPVFLATWVAAIGLQFTMSESWRP
jgi:hypothetical protein